MTIESRRSRASCDWYDLYLNRNAATASSAFPRPVIFLWDLAISEMSPPTAPDLRNEHTSWQRPSIRIRRLSSNNAISRPRAATINVAGRPRAGSGNAQGRHATPVASTPDRGPDGYFSGHAPTSFTTRPRSGSGSDGQANRGVNHDGGRRRSSSDPARRSSDTPLGTHARGAVSHIAPQMPVVREGDAAADTPERPPATVLPAGYAGESMEDTRGGGVGKRMGNAWQASTRFLPTLGRTNSRPAEDRESQFETDLVNVLDTIGESQTSAHDKIAPLTHLRPRGLDPQYTH